MPIRPARIPGEDGSLEVSDHQDKDTSRQSENNSREEGYCVPSVVREPKIGYVREWDRFKTLIQPRHR